MQSAIATKANAAIDLLRGLCGWKEVAFEERNTVGCLYPVVARHSWNGSYQPDFRFLKWGFGRPFHSMRPNVFTPSFRNNAPPRIAR